MERSDGMHASINPLSAEQSLFFDIKFLAREQGIFQRADREFQKGVDLGEKNPTSLEKTRVRTAVESAVLELEYPQLTLLPQMPPLFRYLRAEELGGSFKRGGDTLLVGSGTTLYESLAASIKPPTSEQTEDVFSNFSERMNTLHSRRNRISKGERSISPDLIDHNIIAIEPDSRQTDGFDKANEMFGVKTQIVNNTLQEARPQLEGRKFDNIILNRLDPRIFESNPDDLTLLMELLDDGGSFVITIGTGNNELERKQRTDFMENMPQVFSESGLKVISRFPQIIKGKDRSLFGPDIVGAIIGQKSF